MIDVEELSNSRERRIPVGVGCVGPGPESRVRRCGPRDNGS
jgi:hypothetical protein